MRSNRRATKNVQKQPAKTSTRGGKQPAKQQEVKNTSTTTEENIQNFFAVYADQQENKVTAAGLTQLCQDLNIDIMSDLAVLVIMWRCQCKTYGSISQSEWTKGMMEMKAPNIQTLQSKLSEIRQVAQNFKGEEYKNICFNFLVREEAKLLRQKLLPNYLNYFQDGNSNPLLNSINFAKKEMRKDWCLINEWDYQIFSQLSVIIGVNMMQTELVSFYFQIGPLIIDEFAEWMAANK